MKINSVEVKTIRALALGRVTTQQNIADAFDITQSMVSRIKNRNRRQSV